MRSLPSLTALALLLAGCAPWNTPMRTVPEKARLQGDSAELETSRAANNYGCSFIEFDGRGSFLDYSQFTYAQAELEKLKAQSNVLLVLYCHGWQNNSQSADVGRFVSFLKKLADSSAVQKKHMRVQGVFLGWRGSSFFPIVSSKDPNTDSRLPGDFGHAPITNPRWQTPGAFDSLLAVPKVLTYWTSKSRAEFYASRVPLSRAVFDLAFRLKNPEALAKGRKHEVFVVGHSFGALMLEQAIGQASVGLITSNWNQDQREARWPFDLIVFLNSAAPSLYAKQLAEFLEDDIRYSAKPRIVSLTSVADQATGVIHPLGNLLDVYKVDLQRRYHPQPSLSVTAGHYYDRTPGHNKYLINHAVLEAGDSGSPPPLDDDRIFARNLDPHEPHPEEFYVRIGNAVKHYRLQDLSDQEPNEARRRAMRDYASNYWIGTVPKEIIKDHGDIWSPSCMQMLAGIYRMTQQLSHTPPQHPVNSVRPD